MKWSLTVDAVLKILGAENCLGKYTGDLTGLADLRESGPGDISFLTGGKYAKHLPEAKASLILVPEGQEGEPGDAQVWVPVKDPSVALASVCAHIEAILVPRPEAGIHPTAIIDPTASIDPSVTVGPYCIIEENVVIGKGTILESQIRIERGSQIGVDCHIFHGAVIGWGTLIGNRCRLFSGVVLGADGFGYHSDATGHHRLPQIGIVVLEDDVDVGANTCIDRARFAETRIGEGTKIDNLVQIGHNNIIGKHNILCAFVGMAGSNVLGDFCVMAGKVGLSGHLKIGDRVTGTAQCGITKDVPSDTILSGTPAQPHHKLMKEQVRVRQLPQLFKRVKALEEARD